MAVGTAIGDVIVRIGARIEAFEKAMKNVGKRMTKVGQDMQAAGFRMSAAITAPISLLGGAAVKSSLDFETAMANVAKTVKGSTEEIEGIGQSLRDMSKQLPVATTELASIAEEAGRLGIQRENILEFTETVVRLAETSTLSSQEAAVALARFANIVQLPQKEIGKLANVITVMGSEFAANEQEITSFALRIAAAGDLIGLTEAEIVGFGTALAAVGIQAEAGGTAISQLFTAISKATEMGGKKLEEFARVAGTTASDFKQRFKTDAKGVVLDFIKGLSRLKDEGDSVFQSLQELGLTSVRLTRAILSTAGAGDLLSDVLDRASEAGKTTTDLFELSEKRFKTAQSQLMLFVNEVKDLAVKLGDQLVPILVDMADVLKTYLLPLIEGVLEVFEALPKPVKVMAIATVALVAALGPLLIIFGTMLALFPAMTAGVTTFTVALNFLAAHPLILALAGITAVVAAFTSFVVGSGEATTETRIFANELERLQHIASDAVEDLRKFKPLSAEFESIAEKADRLKVRLEKLRSAGKSGTAQFADMREEIVNLQIKARELVNDMRNLDIDVDFSSVLKDLEALEEQFDRTWGRGAMNYLDEAGRAFVDSAIALLENRAAAAKNETAWQALGEAIDTAQVKLNATGDVLEYNRTLLSEWSRWLDTLAETNLPEYAGKLEYAAAIVDLLRAEIERLTNEQRKNAREMETTAGIVDKAFGDYKSNVILTQAAIESGLVPAHDILRTRVDDVKRAMVDMLSEASKGVDEQGVLVQRLQEVMSADRFQALRAQLAALNAEMAAQSQQREAEIRRQQELMKNRDYLEEAMEAWDEWGQHARDILANVLEATLSLTEQFTRGFGDAIAQVLVYGESFAEVMQALFQRIAAAAISAIVQIIAQWVIATILGIGQGAAQTTARMGQLAMQTYAGAFAATAAIPIVGPFIAPGVAAGALAAMLIGAGAAAGAGAALGATTAFAEGGIVTRPTRALIGEKGPEAVIPLKRGRGQIGMSDIGMDIQELNEAFEELRDSIAALDRIVRILKQNSDLFVATLHDSLRPELLNVKLAFQQIAQASADADRHKEGFKRALEALWRTIIFVSAFEYFMRTLPFFGAGMAHEYAMGQATKAAIPMKRGGIAISPTIALIGEKGPEAVVPLKRISASFGVGSLRRYGFMQSGSSSYRPGYRESIASQYINPGGPGEPAQLITIMLDGRIIARSLVRELPKEIQMRTGVSAYGL